MHMMVTGARIAAVAVGVPIFVATVVLGAFSTVGTLARASEHHAASYAWHGGDITLNTSAGNVEVVSGPGTQVTVEYTEHYQLKRPTITASIANNGVHVGARCPGGVIGSNCEVNYVLTVPDSARLVIQSGDGSITGTQLTSPALQASTGNGAIRISWSVAPTSVVASTGNGGIDLLVPRLSGPYRTSAHTGNGRVDVGVPTASSAGPSLTARTGNGSISIAYNG